jgi:sialate O-acetylesterase
MENKKIKISCLGDSITFGLLASSPEHSYPSNLNFLLGEKYCVGNFGRSGATVINDFDVVENRYSPYLKVEEYKQAMESDPDIAILMLGMNDANPTHHFNEENGGPISEYYIELYQKLLTEIIEGLKDLESKPEIFLVKTTEMKRTVEQGFSVNYVTDFLENLKKIRDIQEKVAKETNVHLIDTYNDMQKDSYYNDGCHLTDEGYAALAKSIYNSVKNK